jgi:hypothetical protein
MSDSEAEYEVVYLDGNKETEQWVSRPGKVNIKYTNGDEFTVSPSSYVRLDDQFCNGISVSWSLKCDVVESTATLLPLQRLFLVSCSQLSAHRPRQAPEEFCDAYERSVHLTICIYLFIHTYNKSSWNTCRDHIPEAQIKHSHVMDNACTSTRVEQSIRVDTTSVLNKAKDTTNTAMEMCTMANGKRM